MAENYSNLARNASTTSGLMATLLVLILVSAGCNVISRLNTPSSNAGDMQGSSSGDADLPTESASAETAAEGKCELDYYPVDPDLSRKYEITGSGPGKYSLTQEGITENSFKEVRTFESGIEITNNWICTDEGLRTAEFTNTGVMQSGRFEMETVKSSGLTIPRRAEQGLAFDASYEVRVKLRAGPVATDATGDVNISNKIVSVGEPVKALGKTFETMRIDSTINIVINLRGRRLEGARVTMANWYAKGAGLVKQETSGTFGKQVVNLVSMERK